MALIKPDFSEISDEVLPGEYMVRITAAEMKQYKSGDDYINWTLDTFNEVEPKNNGRKIWYSTPIKGKAAFLLQRLYSAATNGAKMTEQFDTESLYGKEIRIVVDKNAKGYTEVKAVRAIN